MASNNITPELRSAKEKFLLYFHDLTACNRICGARFFRVFNSSWASGSHPIFQSFWPRSGVLSRGVFASVLSLFGSFSLPIFNSSGRLSGRRSAYLMGLTAERSGL